MGLRNTLGNIYRKTRNKFYSPNKDATLLFGFNKSGTTVTINLIAECAGISFIDDPTYKLDGFEEVLEGKLSLRKYLNRHSYYFSRELFRYPAYPEALHLAIDIFRLEKFILTIRNPLTNIRSILSRLNLRGDLNGIDTERLDFHSEWMNMLKKKENYIESLAQHWVDVYSQELFEESNSYVLFRYEDFMRDKVGYVNDKVIELGYEPKNNISHLVNVQYQPKGTNKSVEDFFGQENIRKIINITGNLAGRFGYELETVD